MIGRSLLKSQIALAICFAAMSTFFIMSVSATPVSMITLEPSSSTVHVGNYHTMTATVIDAAGVPLESQYVTFELISGPHSGAMASAYTDSNGQVFFKLYGVNTGTDFIVASFIDEFQETVLSNEVTCTWVDESIPEFPTVVIPIAAIIGLAFIFNRRKEE